ncbi:MAG TPA: flavin reductase family protein [Acetobacteraceae bacterium]|nr:flavin reductase family protein [Acetobacteraceae bacterium]
MLFDFAALSPDNRYKLLTSTIVPRPIAWITSLDAEGRLNAAPFSFFNALAGDPPIVGVGIGGRHPGRRAGHWKDSAANIRARGEFVVNLVPYELREAMNITAIEFEAELDEVAEAGLETAPSTKVAPPRLAASPVALECERFVTLEVAVDRTIVLGRVVAMHVRDDAVLNAERCHIDTPKLDLIGRMHGGGWYARTTDRFEMPRIPVTEWPRKG